MPVVDLIAAAHRALLVLNRSSVDYALAGGLAVGVHGHVRATEDIDIVVPDKCQAQIARSALIADGWLVRTGIAIFPDGSTLDRAVLAQPPDHAVLDIITAPPGWNLLHDRQRSELRGCACWVIGRDSLVRMKRSAGRPKDLDDVAHLSRSL